jgi:uncharacterized protein (DUF2147 family)
LAALTGLLLASPAHAAAPIFGRWLTDDGAAIIRIEPCGARLCGRIERVLDPKAPRNDINSPDRAHRTKPLVGTAVLSNYSGSGSIWKGGQAYDPKAGKSYRSELTLLANGKLKVTGCVLFICRSRYWTRSQ